MGWWWGGVVDSCESKGTFFQEIDGVLLRGLLRDNDGQFLPLRFGRPYFLGGVRLPRLMEFQSDDAFVESAFSSRQILLGDDGSVTKKPGWILGLMCVDLQYRYTTYYADVCFNN